MVLNRYTQWMVQSVRTATPVWIVGILLCCGIGLFFLRGISLDTNIARLLPDNNPVAQWMKKLQGPLGDGGYFTILLEGENRKALEAAAGEVEERAGRLGGVAFANSRNPVEFLRKYKYTLLPVPALERVYDYALRLEAELNPFGSDLLSGGDGDDAPEDKVERNRQRRLEKSLERFSSLTEYNENDDGTIIGIIIYPKSMITNLEAVRKLYNELDGMCREVGKKYGVKGEIGGSQIRNLREYKSIIEDLGTAGTISGLAIMAVLLFCFRSVRIIPVVVLPLFVGLGVSFAVVPYVVGPLNIITVFLLLILFGMGIDYSIHLIRHFQQQLQTTPLADALYQTFSATGKSVIISGLTTAFPLFVLAFSGFRGFSDYGIIGGLSIVMMLVAMFTVLPVLLVLAERRKVVGPGVTLAGSLPPPGRKLTLLSLVCIGMLFFFTVMTHDLFDYNFSAHSSDDESSREFDAKHRTVYKYSLVPAALYLANDLATLDSSLALLNDRMEKKDSSIERLTSVRDYAPDRAEFGERLQLIGEIREIFAGSWHTKITDPAVRRWVTDLLTWTAPSQPAAIADLPREIQNYYLARDGSQKFVLGIYPGVSRRNGHEVLSFCEELRQVVPPEGLQGPVGEMVIFGEILKIVLKEAPLVLIFALLSVAVPISCSSSSVREVLLTLFPLLAGMTLLIGVMGVLGMQINYLSIVALPTLLGLGVDDGVHYFRHCKAHGYDVDATQGELFGTLSVCTLTTMIGYFGLVVAHNRGLQSLGILACLGMACLWFTSVFLLPALLRRRQGATG